MTNTTLLSEFFAWNLPCNSNVMHNEENYPWGLMDIT